jgi:hypothetical protein
MVSYKLTDEELIEIASSDSISDDEEVWDIRYYQQTFNIVDGNYKMEIDHIYHHYSNWSSNPVSIKQFVELLNLEKKTTGLYINQHMCNFSIVNIVGDYVKKEKDAVKKERLRKISGIKPKAKR